MSKRSKLRPEPAKETAPQKSGEGMLRLDPSPDARVQPAEWPGDGEHRVRPAHDVAIGQSLVRTYNENGELVS
jgi:hypothetical protein